MTPNPFLIPVADLVAEPGARRDAVIDTRVEWSIDAAALGPDLHADVVIENASGTIVARGSATTRLGLACHRCLTEWTETLDTQFTEAFGVEGDDDGYALEADVADLEPMLRDIVLLEVPLRPLCRDDCLGLCGTCGADLNTGSCPGHDDEEATPFSVLRELLEP